MEVERRIFRKIQGTPPFRIPMRQFINDHEVLATHTAFCVFAALLVSFFAT